MEWAADAYADDRPPPGSYVTAVEGWKPGDAGWRYLPDETQESQEARRAANDPWKESGVFVEWVAKAYIVHEVSVVVPWEIRRG